MEKRTTGTANRLHDGTKTFSAGHSAVDHGEVRFGGSCCFLSSLLRRTSFNALRLCPSAYLTLSAVFMAGVSGCSLSNDTLANRVAAIQAEAIRSCVDQYEPPRQRCLGCNRKSEWVEHPCVKGAKKAMGLRERP